jgi:hypothetical protein
VSYAFVQDIAASWHDYRQVAATLVDPPPTGLILHAAGPTDEGVRIIAIWDNEPAWQRFRTETLEPAIARLAGPARPEPTFRGLRPAHTVIGAAMARPDRFRLQTGDALNPSEKPLRPARGSEDR